MSFIEIYKRPFCFFFFRCRNNVILSMIAKEIDGALHEMDLLLRINYIENINKYISNTIDTKHTNFNTETKEPHELK